MQADDQRRRPGAVVALRDVEQIPPLNARRPEPAVVPIRQIERYGFDRDHDDGETDERQGGAKDPASVSHRFRFHASASGAADSRASGIARMARSMST